ncbi:hypothetical protein KFK09_025517 [Dendrobium nobile]|uniref:Uncharacterized protein n=1 Tax=Dendrobium nobile TaxID=94219 RepID=A0A8T3AGD9_DENNO|nr:hypothetical protein KFK09_025517 [Dendrobium nobile]
MEASPRTPGVDDNAETRVIDPFRSHKNVKEQRDRCSDGKEDPYVRMVLLTVKGGNGVREGIKRRGGEDARRGSFAKASMEFAGD